MRAGSVWTRARADVRGRRAHPETLVREQVLDAERQRERVAGLGSEQVIQDHPVGLALRDGPRDPADQPVDGVGLADLVQRELVTPPLELVRTVFDPVRPGDQHLPAARGAHLVRPVVVEEGATGRRVGAEPRADPGDDGALVVEPELDLLPGRKAQPSASSSRTLRWLSVYSSPSEGRTTATATPKTMSTAVRVSLGAAPSAILSVFGSRYGYWAAPQPQITATTAPTARGRTPRRAPRQSNTSAPNPNAAEASTSGRASLVRPS